MTVKQHRGDNTIAYAANAVNEYTSIGGVSVAYEACGNLSKDAAGYSYAYDHDNRLVCVYTDANADGDYDAGTDTGHGLYAYDALGRRIRTILGGVTMKCYYDGQRVILETDDAGTTDRRMFAYGNYIDEVLALVIPAQAGIQTYYYGHDHLFSVCVLFDDSGAITEYTEYDAYGYARTGTAYGLDQTWFTADDTVADGGGSNVGNPYFFTGRRLDLLDAGALPLMYYRARTYDPVTGRFLQRDAAVYLAGMSLYEYVLSRPLYALDPLGLCPNGFAEWTETDEREREAKQVKSLPVHKDSELSARYPISELYASPWERDIAGGILNSRMKMIPCTPVRCTRLKACVKKDRYLRMQLLRIMYGAWEYVSQDSLRPIVGGNVGVSYWKRTNNCIYAQAAMWDVLVVYKCEQTVRELRCGSACRLSSWNRTIYPGSYVLSTGRTVTVSKVQHGTGGTCVSADGTVWAIPPGGDDEQCVGYEPPSPPDPPPGQLPGVR